MKNEERSTKSHQEELAGRAVSCDFVDRASLSGKKREAKIFRDYSAMKNPACGI